jgi:general secretion pathway protein E
MTGPQSLQFVEHLRRAGHLRSMEASRRSEAGAAEQALSGPPSGQNGSQNPAGKLWDATNLSAHEFAEEAARFFGLERVSLQDLLAGASLTDAFASRFLRETVV